MIKMKLRKTPPKNASERSILLNSKSRQQSSSGEDKKSNSSLKKKLQKHLIFDKQPTQPNSQTLHKIRQQTLEQDDVKWKSEGQLSLKEKIVQFLEKQAQKNKNIIKSQRSIDQRLVSQTTIKDIDIDKKQLKQQRTIKQIPKESQKRSEQINTGPEQIVIQNYKPSEDRQSEILRRKYESNLKYLTTQTSQLFSINKFMLLEEEIKQTKKNMSELNIYLRQLRINMRNHEYTKQINFTFPVNKHNDTINVKMPQQVERREMNRYLILEEKLKTQNQLSIKNQQKLNNLIKYHLNLLKKFDPIIDPKQSHLNGSLKIIEEQQGKNKLSKVKSSQNISLKTSKAVSSLSSSKSGTLNRKNSAKVIPTQKTLAQSRYFTLKEKKQTLVQGLEKLKNFIAQKTTRLSQEVQLYRKQISFFDENILQTQQKIKSVVEEVNLLRKKKMQIADQNRRNVQKYVQSIENQTIKRKMNYLKEKDKRNVESKGFANNLRQNKSLSPQNYLPVSTKRLSNYYSPKNIK